MPTVLKSDLEIINAKNFIADLDSNPSQDHRLYVGISRTTVWVDENIPPVPKNNDDDETSFWSELIGLQLVDVTDIKFVVPRIDWSVGQEYYLFDSASETSYDQDFYVMNSQLEVYQCVGKTSGGITVSAEPTGHNNGANIVTGDGYTWKFLYKISLTDFTDMVTTSWITVDWDTSDTGSDQYFYGDVNAYKTLGSKYVMVRTNLVDSASGGLPDGVTYRQVGIVYDPLDDTTANLVSGIALPAGLTSGSGTMLYLENKSPINRNPGQSELIKVVLEF